MSLVGQQIKQYYIRDFLAEGGMAEVYLAEDVLNRRAVAVKILSSRLSQNDSLVVRFKREAETTQALNHPYIIRVYEVAQIPNDGRWFMVMDYAPNGSLYNLKRQYESQRSRIPDVIVLNFMRKVTGAVAYLHDQGIVHRDLKPANILLKADNDPVVTDLGIAGVNTAHTLTEQGQVLGTFDYMSPEQMFDTSQTDYRTDIYALGVILYELLAGRFPFNGDNSLVRMSQKQTQLPLQLKSFRPDLETELCQIIHKCVEQRPDKRYQSARHLVTDLDRYLIKRNLQISDPAITPRPKTQPVSQQLSKRRNLTPLFGGLIGLALILAIIIGGLMLAPGQPNNPIAANQLSTRPGVTLVATAAQEPGSDTVDVILTSTRTDPSLLAPPTTPSTATPTASVPPTEETILIVETNTPSPPQQVSNPITLSPGLLCNEPEHIFSASQNIEFKWTGTDSATVAERREGMFLVVQQNGQETGWIAVEPSSNLSRTPQEWLAIFAPNRFSISSDGAYTWIVEHRATTNRNSSLLTSSIRGCFTVGNRPSSGGGDSPEPTPNRLP